MEALYQLSYSPAKGVRPTRRARTTVIWRTAMVLLRGGTSNTGVGRKGQAGRLAVARIRNGSNSGRRALHRSTDRGETGLTEERNENVPGGVPWALHDEVHSGC